MINKDNLGSVAVIGGTSADRISPDGLVTAITSETVNNFVIFGLTFGAWVTLALGIGTFIVLLINIRKLVLSFSESRKKIAEAGTGGEED